MMVGSTPLASLGDVRMTRIVIIGGGPAGYEAALVAAGADPRVLPGAEPDGERVLDWRDVYELDEAPEHLVVVGSGVTGAEFASGYLEAGVPGTLVSSRDRVLPGEDSDAAEVLEEVFTSRGGRLERGRAAGVRRTEKGGGLVRPPPGHQVPRQDERLARRFREPVRPPLDRRDRRRRRGRPGRLGARAAHRARRHQGADRERPGAHLRDLPVAVRLDHRGR